MTCGGGIRTYTRTKNVTADHGGDDCDGRSSYTETCNLLNCTGYENSV